MKNITDFLNDIKAGELYEKYKEIQAECESLPSNERVDFVIAFAKENGYEITVEDLALADADKQTLDDNELDRASGGLASKVEGREYCTFDYICGAAWNTCLCSDECEAPSVCSGNLYCSQNDYYCSSGHSDICDDNFNLP